MIHLLRVFDALAFSKAIESGESYINMNILEYFSPLFSCGIAPFLVPAIMALLVAAMTCLTMYAIKQDMRSLQ